MAGDSPNSNIDPRFMSMALEEARKAEALGEVPVGAVVVLDHDPLTNLTLDEPQWVSSAHNLRETAHNPVAHAELLAIEAAAKKLGRWRLSGCTLYVTLEPCVMCSGAIVLSRVDRVVYGADDPKAGAVKSLYGILSDERLNHRPEVVSGVMAPECSEILKNFFRVRREK